VNGWGGDNEGGGDIVDAAKVHSKPLEGEMGKIWWNEFMIYLI